MMEKQVYESSNREETYELGVRLGREAKAGDIFAVTGDLGAGKTLFVKGFARGLGVKEELSSPTFNILKSYRSGRLPLYHFDVYRIEDISEMDETGYEDCFYGNGVTLIEWAEQIEALLPPETLRIRIERKPEKGPDYREITTDDHTFR